VELRSSGAAVSLAAISADELFSVTAILWDARLSGPSKSKKQSHDIIVTVTSCEQRLEHKERNNRARTTDHLEWY
jgi:hypothetical protein